ncbi:kinase-like domain-containing protein [Gigaspora margarita]|uniref:Kinase-like domain-containing protein n=1 Tax=Gigaspora margarita TaxID=4874 RepID=A0A8H4EIW6_GIGMA|nr:kinase-like domain-containing protein [Gigaspora margarita]
MGKEFNKFNKLRTYAAITKNLVTESPEWTSGNEQIDAFIHQIHSPFSDKFFEWIPYEKFINVEYLAKGGFGQVFTAWWPEGKISGYNFDTNCVERSVIDMVDIFRPEDGKGLKVALKLLSSKTNMEALCDELRSYLAVSRFRNSFVVECYGMTKNPDGKYLLVLQYGGKILKQVLAEEIDKKELTWNKMIYKVRDIAAGLSGIHIIGNRIHRDLHSGNIVQRDFINRCWENDPQKRPTSFDLHMQALSWYSANDQAIREQLNKAEEYLRKNPPKRNRRPPETYTRLDTQKVLDAISGRIPTQDVTVEKTYTQEIGATYTIKENISTPTEQEVVEPVQEIIDTSTELIPDELTAYLISYWLKDAPWLNNIRKKEIARRII